MFRGYPYNPLPKDTVQHLKASQIHGGKLLKQRAWKALPTELSRRSLIS